MSFLSHVGHRITDDCELFFNSLEDTTRKMHKDIDGISKQSRRRNLQKRFCIVDKLNSRFHPGFFEHASFPKILVRYEDRLAGDFLKSYHTYSKVSNKILLLGRPY
jgi:hypothetical protein